MNSLHSAIPRVIGSATLAVLLAACQKVPMLPGLSTYRIDVQQGNVLSQDMVAKLKPGMTRQQVRFVLGTPPIVDPFRQDRWDYVYFYKKGGTVIEHRRLVLHFEGEALKRIDGDVVVGADGAGQSAPRAVGSAAPSPSQAVPVEASGAAPKSP